MVTWIETETQARALAEALLQPGRERPAAVVSVQGGRKDPFVNVDELDKAVGGDCDIYVIPTGALTFAFADPLPPGRQVYGGASRVYSADNAWVQDQYASPLRFAFAPDTDGRVLTALIEDAMTAAHAAGRGLGHRPRVTGAGRPVNGVVQGIVAGRVLVDVERVFPAVVFPDRLVPGLGADRLFQERQRVDGMLNLESNVMEVSALRPVGEALRHIAVHTVVLARVGKVSMDTAALDLHPAHSVELGRTAEDDLRASYTSHEVVPVEVTEVGRDGLPASVGVLPANFAELAEAVVLLDGGPPWLLPADVEASGPVPDAPEPDAVVATAHIDEAKDADVPDHEVQGLRQEVVRLQVQVDRLQAELQQSRSRTRAAQQRGMQTEKALQAATESRAVATPGLFASDEEQFMHELYVSWAERTTAADKEQFGWRKPEIGPAFLDTLRHVQGVERAKVVEVAADVVCGRADTMPARAVHQLRTGPGGDDPPVIRPGGETCWRAYLQQSTASARRLHYWRLNDGRVEFSAVRVHDDYTP